MPMPGALYFAMIGATSRADTRESDFETFTNPRNEQIRGGSSVLAAAPFPRKWISAGAWTGTGKGDARLRLHTHQVERAQSRSDFLPRDTGPWDRHCCSSTALGAYIGDLPLDIRVRIGCSLRQDQSVSVGLGPSST
ncbi:hypothetical protein ACJZ2D_014351 [Fusarium nematophilum]